MKTTKNNRLFWILKKNKNKKYYTWPMSAIGPRRYAQAVIAREKQNGRESQK